MIELPDRRLAGMGQAARARARFHVIDMREFEPRPKRYDLIVSHFFLDCFSDADLASVVACLASWAAPDVAWVVSDFRETRGSLGRIWTSGVTHALYAAFRLTTGLRVSRLPDYVSAILRAGFQLRYEQKRFERSSLFLGLALFTLRATKVSMLES
jgi:hypothetical protein